MQFGKFTGADLRLFLRLVGVFQREEKELIDLVREEPEKLLGPDAVSVYWCGFYEKPFIEHLAALVGALDLGDTVKEFTDVNGVEDAP